MKKHWAAELRHLCLHSLLAVSIWLVPQRGHFALFRLLTRLHPWLLPTATQAADALLAWRPQLQSHRRSLVLGCALHQLVDQADYYLTKKYGRDWLLKNLEVEGQRPNSEGPAPLFMTLHYGQGFWAIRYFNECWQLPLAWLHLPPPTNSPPGERLATGHARRRVRQVERLAGAAAIPTGGSVTRMRERLCVQGLPVLVMPDVPPGPEQETVAVQLLGRAARLPVGALSLAIRHRLPVYIYTVHLQRHNGQRLLRLHGPYCCVEVQELADQVASILEEAIIQDPCAWHLWPHFERFYSR